MSATVAKMQLTTLSRIVRIATCGIALLIFASPVPFVAAQCQAQKLLLIDMPGANWTGEERQGGHWGNALLSADKVTIYIRHEGPGGDQWPPPPEPNAIVITLPNQWDDKSADETLLPVLKQAFEKCKDVHVIVDKNITLSGHLLPRPQSQEDRWAAMVVEYIIKHKPSNFIGVLAEHSRGTVTNAYIINFDGISYVILASPRGDQSLEFIWRIPSSVKVDIITAIWDAPSWRWFQRLSDIIKNPNVRIIQLHDFGGPVTTHSRVQQTKYYGTWKIITATGETVVQGTLEQILELPGRRKDLAMGTPQPTADVTPQGLPTVDILPPWPTNTPQPPLPSTGGTRTPSGMDQPPPPNTPRPSSLGGVNFASVDLRYLTEFDGNTIGVGFRALPTKDGIGLDLMQAIDLAWNSFFTWLALSPEKFWVNLNPNEPSRIIDPEFGRTDAGRIMLQADLEMKKTVAKLIHPDSATGKAFWDQLYDYAERQQIDRLCSSLRQWIVPGNVIVYADADEIYIVDATLDVKLESDYLKLPGTDAAVAAVCDVDPTLQVQAAALFREMILPELIKEVNTAPEYREIRSIFNSRIVAEWYKTQHRANAQMFANIIERGNAADWYSATPWSPQALFEEYLRLLTQGVFSITRQTQTIEGNYIITITRTYFYGGVDFTKLVLNPIDYSTLITQKPGVNQQVYDALFNLTGASGEGEVWFGGLYSTSQGGGEPPQMPVPALATSSPIAHSGAQTGGALTPAATSTTSSPNAQTGVALTPAATSAASSPNAQTGGALTPVATSTPSGSSFTCGISAIAMMLFILIGWLIVRRLV